MVLAGPPPARDGDTKCLVSFALRVFSAVLLQRSEELMLFFVFFSWLCFLWREVGSQHMSYYCQLCFIQ